MLARNPIREIVSLPVKFPSSKLLFLDFFVTLLDSSCKAVLGYNFLCCYNPSIDWSKGKLSFPKHADSKNLLETSTPSVVDVSTPLESPSLSLTSNSEPFVAQPNPEQDSSTPTTSGKPLCQGKSLYEKFPFKPIYSYPSVAQPLLICHSEG